MPQHQGVLHLLSGTPDSTPAAQMCGSDGCSDSCSQVSAFRRNPLSLRLFDSHCHPNGGFDSVHSRVCILATEEADWPLALSASRQCVDAVVGFGVHPWFAHRTSCGWVERLRDHLLSEGRVLFDH